MCLLISLLIEIQRKEKTGGGGNPHQEVNDAKLIMRIEGEVLLLLSEEE